MTSALSEAGTLLLAGTLPPRRQLGSDPRHSVRAFEGVAGLWYLDDRDIPCHPRLVAPYPDAFDAANEKIGTKPNRTAPKDQLELLKMRDSIALRDGMLTLGVAKRARRCASSYLHGNNERRSTFERTWFHVGLTVIMRWRRMRTRSSVRRFGQQRFGAALLANYRSREQVSHPQPRPIRVRV